MAYFDEEAALDLLERGIRLAQDNPGEVVRVEFTKLNACVDLSVDWDDRRDPTFLASLALSAVEDLKRHARVSSRGLVLASTPCAVCSFGADMP